MGEQADDTIIAEEMYHGALNPSTSARQNGMKRVTDNKKQ